MKLGIKIVVFILTVFLIKISVADQMRDNKNNKKSASIKVSI